MPVTRVGQNLPQIPDENAGGDNRNPQVLKAARMYENQFLREMVRAMKKTVPESEFMPESYAEKIFREQLDDQVVDTWTDRGGVGMADVIYDQVMDRYFAGGARPKPQGPIKVTDRISMSPVAKNLKDVTFEMKSTGNEKQEVLAPWSGEVVGVQSLDHGYKSLLLDHGQNDENGYFSSILFNGDLVVGEGAKVSAGQKLGLLSPENAKIIWKIRE